MTSIYRSDISSASIHAAERQVRRHGGARAAVRRGSGVEAVRSLPDPGTLRAVRRHTDYTLARRAVLRDLQRGAVARLDVCDAHPELLRAARHVGEPAPHRLPGVRGAPRALRLLRLRRRSSRQANGRCIVAPERARAPRRRARRVRPLRRRGLPRLPVEPPHPPRAPRPRVTGRRCPAAAPATPLPGAGDRTACRD